MEPFGESGIELSVLDLFVVGGEWAFGEVIVVMVYEVEVFLEVFLFCGGVAGGGFII